MDLKCLVWIIGAAIVFLWGTFNGLGTYVHHDNSE